MPRPSRNFTRRSDSVENSSFACCGPGWQNRSRRPSFPCARAEESQSKSTAPSPAVHRLRSSRGKPAAEAVALAVSPRGALDGQLFHQAVDFRAVYGLEQIAIGPEVQRALGALKGVHGRQQNDVDSFVLFPDAPHALEPVHPRHFDVHDHQVRLCALIELKRFLAVRGCPGNPVGQPVPVHNVGHDLAYDRFVVSETHLIHPFPRFPIGRPAVPGRGCGRARWYRGPPGFPARFRRTGRTGS